LVRSRFEGGDFEVAVLVDFDGAAQVPFGDVGGELRVEAIFVGVPQFGGGVGQSPAFKIGDWD